MRSRSSRASARTGAALGSISALSSFERTVFVEPCSPDIASTGYGPRDRSVASSHITVNTSSMRLFRLRRGTTASIDPPAYGNGSGSMPAGAAEADGRGFDYAPSGGSNFDGAPPLAGEIKINMAGMSGRPGGGLSARTGQFA